MGANPYCYFTPFSQDIQAALDQLRQTEFFAGRYEPCFLEKTGEYLFEHKLAPRDTFPSPGSCHEAIEEIYDDFDAGGSNSILDIVRIADQPFQTVADPMSAPDILDRFNTSAPLSENELISFFGTKTPTRTQIENIILATGEGPDPDIDVLNKRDSFWEGIGRGQARHILTYRDGAPVQIFFAGMSFD